MAPDRSTHLADIYRRAAAIRVTRTRKLLGVGGALAVGATVAVLAVGLGSGGRGSTDLAATDLPAAPTTSTEPAPDALAAPDPVTLPTPASELPTSSAPTTAAAAGPATSATTSTPPPAPGRATTTARVCRNSREPRCGAFRYDPVPANRPTDLRATPSATTLPTGTPVEMRVVATDPDSQVGSFNCTDGVDWADTAMIPQPVCSASCAQEEPRYGPWDPPPPKPGLYQVTSTHTYSQPGTYVVKVGVTTPSCDFSPYTERASTTVTVTVTP